MMLAVIAIAAAFITYSIVTEKDYELDGKTFIKVQLQWFHGAQFTGLYVANEKGFFKDEGLMVDLIPIAGFTTDPISVLNNEEVDIALAPADRILIRKDKDATNIKAFGTVFNRSLACYTMKESEFMDSLGLKSLENKKLAVFPKFDTENILLVLKNKWNLNINKNDIVQAPAGYIQEFEKGNLDVIGTYLINEPVQLRMKGRSIKIIDPVEFGVRFYSDTYIAKTDVWARNDNEKGIKLKDLEKFIRAANKGWLYAKEHPKEAIDIMFKNIDNKSKSIHGELELEALKEAVKYLGSGTDKYYANMEREIWEEMESDLYDIGRLTQKGLVEDLCDFDLIKKAYE